MNAATIGTRPSTPFKELDFFVEDDVRMFAGREREARLLLSRIVSLRAVVVHARSGLGKTSLLRAGVIPLLRLQNFYPVYVRTLDSLLGDLAEAIVQDCHLPSRPSGDEQARARQAIEVAASIGPVVLIFDQFEEFFTRFERQPLDRQAFAQFVTDIVRDETRDVRVVFSLREDFLYALDEFQRNLPELFAHAFRLLPLTPLGAREAIIRPLTIRHIPYDDALVTQLVDELTGFDFDSARLQVVCSEVYRHAVAETQGRVELRARDLDSLKESTGAGLRGIYKRYLREALDNIDPVLHLETKLLLQKLISAKRTKFAVSREGLHAEFCDTRRVDLVLTALVEQRLVRDVARGGKDWFELRHECLVDEIIEWFKEDTTFDSFQFVRRLIEEHSSGGRFRTRPERLLTAEQLAALTPLREHLRLAPEELEYVLQSAVYTQAPDLGTWAKTDPIFAARMSKTLIASSLLPMRVGAVRCMAQLVGIDSELSAFCIALAFDKSVPEELREAARTSAAVLATDEDLVHLWARSRSSFEKRQLREFSVDLYAAGRMGPSFSALSKWLTRQGFIRRRVAQFRAQRADFLSRGTMGGVLGGGIAAVAAVAYMGYNLWSSIDENDTQILLLVFAALVASGALIGWRNGNEAFKSCAIGEMRWWKSSLPSLSRITKGPWSAVAIVILAAVLSVYSAGWLLIRLLLSALVAALAPVVLRVTTNRQRILFSSLLSVVPAVLVIYVFARVYILENRVWLIFPGLLLLLNIELCSFCLAIPRTGIEGAFLPEMSSGPTPPKP